MSIERDMKKAIELLEDAEAVPESWFKTTWEEERNMLLLKYCHLTEDHRIDIQDDHFCSRCGATSASS